MRDVLLGQVARHLLAAGKTLGVLGADGVTVGADAQRLNGLEELDLLVADMLGGKGARLFHRDQREELHRVVLQHVTRGAAAVVIAAAGADAEFFGDGDLHVVDVATVPERLEDRVGET